MWLFAVLFLSELCVNKREGLADCLEERERKSLCQKVYKCVYLQIEEVKWCPRGRPVLSLGAL